MIAAQYGKGSSGAKVDRLERLRVLTKEVGPICTNALASG